MRSTANRILHAIAFEAGGLALITPIGALVMAKPMAEMGVVTLFGTLIATGWNYFYNLFFDHAMQRLRGSPEKTPRIRLIHAALFEGGLLAVIVPFAAWWLQIGFIAALLLDIGFAGIYLVYALLFNWVWERAFPYQPAQNTGQGNMQNAAQSAAQSD